MVDFNKKTDDASPESVSLEDASERLRVIYAESIQTLSDAFVVHGTTPFETIKLLPDHYVRLHKSSSVLLKPPVGLMELFEVIMFGSVMLGVLAVAGMVAFGINMVLFALVLLGIAAIWYMGTAAEQMKKRANNRLAEEREAVLLLAPLLSRTDVTLKKVTRRKAKVTAVNFKKEITVEDHDLFVMGLALLSACNELQGDPLDREFAQTFPLERD